MVRIMFVCHGNICRSPMAEFIFKDLLQKENLSERFVVSSSATSREEIIGGVGNPVYPPVKRVLEKHSISCDGKRAVQVKADDYGKYDLFIAMDTANVVNLRRIFSGDPDGKIRMLKSFTDTPGDVDDPWFTGMFDLTFNEIFHGCERLLEYTKKLIS